ncbi:MAG: hypothetical protein R3D70_12095 [Rhizobiaceae bacterium]
MIDDDEPITIHSPLRQRIERDGTYIDVEIYRGEDEEGWILEVVDEEDASTVYHERFPTDQAALDEVLRVIAAEGIRAFLEDNAGSIN